MPVSLTKYVIFHKNDNSLLSFNVQLFECKHLCILFRFLGTAPGNFGAILSTKERPIGYYPVTMATLNFLLKLIHGMSNAEETGNQAISIVELAACLVFIMREVFTGFYKWRFSSLRDREEIGKFAQRIGVLL